MNAFLIKLMSKFDVRVNIYEDHHKENIKNTDRIVYTNEENTLKTRKHTRKHKKTHKKTHISFLLLKPRLIFLKA